MNKTVFTKQQPVNIPFKHTAETKEIGRNALCPCGSGKKYKHCHKYARTMPFVVPPCVFEPITDEDQNEIKEITDGSQIG